LKRRVQSIATPFKDSFSVVSAWGIIRDYFSSYFSTTSSVGFSGEENFIPDHNFE